MKHPNHPTPLLTPQPTPDKTLLSALRREKILFQIMGWLLCYLPLACLLILRREIYFQGFAGVKMGCGVIIALVCSVAVAVGKLKLPGRALTLWGIVALVWMLIPVLQDLQSLLLMLAVGVSADSIICQPRIRRITARIEREK